MNGVKLYGSYSGAFQSRNSKKRKSGQKKKRRTAFDRILSLMLVLVVLESLYCIAAFSDIPVIKKYRDLWIETAMSTMRHQWLATAFFPGCVVDDVMARMQAARESQVGVNSHQPSESDPGQIQTQEPEQQQEDPNGLQPGTPEAAFYDLFWEIDMDSMNRYLDRHPGALDGGWANLLINEAGLDDDGTEIYTTMGEQVLAIDVPNQILLVRVEGEGYKGVLAVAKNDARLSIQPSGLKGVGQYAGDIASAHDGVLAMNASSFIDDGGVGNGGDVAGYTMMDGVERGRHMYDATAKRLELHEDNRFYITDASDDVSYGTTDAMEFYPALIVDGKMVVDENSSWNGIQPRACMGQSDKGEYLMLAIEGRRLDSVGTGVFECAKILQRHDCWTAMNLDGGSTAILWYDGEYIIHCSNGIREGRMLPNAFVYTKND